MATSRHWSDAAVCRHTCKRLSACQQQQQLQHAGGAPAVSKHSYTSAHKLLAACHFRAALRCAAISPASSVLSPPSSYCLSIHHLLAAASWISPSRVSMASRIGSCLPPAGPPVSAAASSASHSRCAASALRSSCRVTRSKALRWPSAYDLSGSVTKFVLCLR